MKTRVAVLTAGVLCVILIVFDTFIYLTLYHHLFNVEKSALTVEAQSISQYYINNNNENQDSTESASVSDYAWLRQYAQSGQTIVLLDKSRNQLAKYGHGPISLMLEDFKHVSEPENESIQTLSQARLYVTIPMVDPDTNKTVGYVLLLSDIPYVKEYMATLLALLTGGSIGAILLASIGGYIISAIAVRPINQMIRLVERIQVSNLNERVTIPKGNDEVSRLASTFNNMLSRIERSFEQQSRFVADASHEIRTPLTTVQGYANLLARWGKRDPAVLEKGIRVIQKESTRMRNLAEDLLVLASLDISSRELPKRTDVNAIIGEIVDSMALLHEQVEIYKDLQAKDYAAIAPAHLKQVLTNLVDNAIKYSSSSGTIHISTATEGADTVIRIIDNGRGIPEDDLPFVFDRFYRVDKVRGRREGGTGLGLAIVKELVEVYGGRIDIESKEGIGTKVTVAIPIYSRS